jgi:hypothetical protein
MMKGDDKVANKKYKVGIYTPNKIFLVKGKVVRSPFEAEVSERELQSIKMKIKTDGIDKYSIEEITQLAEPIIKPYYTKENIEKNDELIKTTDIKIEELEEKSKSLLDKFISS